MADDERAMLSWLLLKRYAALVIVTGMLTMNAESALSLDAQHWQQLPDSAKRYYVLGSVEAWNEALRFTSDVSEAGLDGMLNAVMPCVERKKLNLDHLLATVQKYVNDHHSDWHMEMAAVVFTAVSQACVQRNGVRPQNEHGQR